MPGTLMKVTNNSVSEKTYDLNSIPERMESMFHHENAIVDNYFYKELEKWSGPMGIFENQIQKEFKKEAIKHVNNRFNRIEKATSLVVDIMLEQVRRDGEKMILAKTQQYDSELIEQAIDIRARLTAVCQTHLDEISVVFHRSRKMFVERICIQEAEADQCKHIDFLYDEYKESIRHETTIFFQIIKDHLEKFRGALNISLQEALRRFSTEA